MRILESVVFGIVLSCLTITCTTTTYYFNYNLVNSYISEVVSNIFSYPHLFCNFAKGVLDTAIVTGIVMQTPIVIGFNVRDNIGGMGHLGYKLAFPSIPGQRKLLELQLVTCYPPGHGRFQNKEDRHMGAFVCRRKGSLVASVAVGFVVHVLHRDPPPHADHKGFNLTLILATSDAKVAVLAPVLPPRVGRNLTTK